MGQPSCLDEIMESENPLKGGNDLELQRNSEGFQPTETKDDSEVRNVSFHSSSPRRFWSSTLHAKKRETFQFHWNTLTWPGWRTQIWICCEKAVSTTIGMSMWIEMWKFTSSKLKTSRRYLRSREPPDFINCDLIFRPTCRKQFRKRKSMNGLLKNGRSTIREDPEDGECKETIKNAKKTLEISMTKESNKIKNKAWMHRGSAWIHEKAFGNYSTERSWRSHRGKRVQINKSLQFGAQVFPMPQARKNSGCESSDKEWEKLEKLSAWQLNQVKSKKRCQSGSTKQKSMLLHWWTSVISKILTTQERMLYSQSKVRLRLKWQLRQ